MRIGMILDYEFPPDPRVENEAISLIEAGHDVYLFCLKYNINKKDEVIRGINVKRYLSTKIEYKLSALAYTLPLYSKRLSKKITDFLLDYQIESIHVHDIQIAGAAFLSNKSLELPLILDLHENRPEIMKFYNHMTKFPGNFLIRPSVWKKKEVFFIQNATTTIVVTEEAKQDVVKRCRVSANSVIVIPNTVHKSFNNSSEIDKKILGKYKDDFVLLYIGDTGLRRGLLTAMESLNNLKNKIMNVKLVIVGSSSYDTDLKQKATLLKVEDYVDFVGWQDAKLFPSYISASSVCISPLHRNQHHDTTYANKIFQYMSFGKPLLVSAATAQANMIRKSNSGLVHRAEDQEDFSERVIEFYLNSNLMKEKGANGKRFIENEFTWDKTSKNLVHLYNTLNS